MKNAEATLEFGAMYRYNQKELNDWQCALRNEILGLQALRLLYAGITRLVLSVSVAIELHNLINKKLSIYSHFDMVLDHVVLHGPLIY